MAASSDHLSTPFAEKKAKEPATAKRKKASATPVPEEAPVVEEIGGPEGPEPTRYGDWERKGRCSDF